ncbi:MAG: putative bifunctional diguanylate cyclase/phosphodiesterase [Sphingorhabdus sp.]
MRLFDRLHLDVIDVAPVQHRIGPYRSGIATILGLLSIAPLGARTALAWLATMLVCEAWTWLATRSSLSGRMTNRQIVNYIASGLATVPCWTMLGVLYWISSVEGSTEIALVIWAAQLIYTQRFIYQSLTAIVIGNISNIAAMLIFPLMDTRLDTSVQILLITGLIVSIGFALSGALMTMRNVQSLSKEKAAVEYGATHDLLTGLMNRSVFQQSLVSAISRDQKSAVLFIDLDRFKRVNDTLGHQAGDALLEGFSKRLKQAVPEDAIVARFGGDEFAVLLKLPETRQELEDACFKIIRTTQKKFMVPGGFAQVGASVGVALLPDHGRNPGELMRKSDLALYSAKAAGRGTFKLFNSEIEATVRERTKLEAELRSILIEGAGLELHYQPKLDSQGSSCSVESLLRWKHPELGDIAPTHIIDIAEDTGLIIPLGQWVIRTALAFAARWPVLGVAINISPAQLHGAGFSDWVIKEAIAAGVEPKRIEFEVTETILLDETPETAQKLKTLREAGFSIALTDFGTGYASLRRLHSFKVDRVKIDKSFLHNLESDAEATAIVQAVIQLGHAMGLQVTAEGVETAAHRNFLKHAGVDEMQGFLFAKAKPEAELLEFFNEIAKKITRAA